MQTRSSAVGTVIRYVTSFSWNPVNWFKKTNQDYNYKKRDDIETGNIPTTEKMTTREVLASYTKLVFSTENQPRIIVATLLTALGTSLNFLAPYILGRMIDSLNNKDEEASNISVDVSSLIAVYCLSQLIPKARDYILAPVAAHNTEKLLFQITENRINKNLAYHIDTPLGDDIYKIQKGFAVSSIGTPLLTQVAPTFLEMTIAVAGLSYQYGASMGVGLATLLSLYTLYCAKTTGPIIEAREEMLKTGNIAWKNMEFAFSQYENIHNFNQSIYSLEKVQKALREAAISEANTVQTPIKLGLGHDIFPRAGMLFAMLYIAMKVRTGQFSKTEFIALYGYLNQLCASVPKVGESLSAIFASYPDLRFVFEKLKEKHNVILDLYPDVMLDMSSGSDIHISNLAYSFSNKSIFKDLSMHVKTGQTVALVSESGKGKSTLFNLLYGFYNADAGTIAINKQDIAKVSRQTLKENIRLVSQKPNLFSGTVRENICYGDKDPKAVTDEEIYSLAKKLNLFDFICSLAKAEKTFEGFKKGLDFDVGESGKKLSGGSQQRVNILRGFMYKAPILLLDEITSALDAESAALVLSGIKRLTQENKTTVIVISHKLREIMDVDNIFVIDDGKISAEGTHAYLLRSYELYRKLWEIQNTEKSEKNILTSSPYTMHYHSPKNVRDVSENNQGYLPDLKS